MSANDDALPAPLGGRVLNPRRVPIEIPRPSRKRSSQGSQRRSAEAVQATSDAAKEAYDTAKARGREPISASRRVSLRRAGSERDRAADQLADAHLSDPAATAADADESTEDMAQRHEKEQVDLRASHAKEMFALHQKQEREKSAAASGSGAQGNTTPKRRKVGDGKE